MTKSLFNDETLAHEYAHVMFATEGLPFSVPCSAEYSAMLESLADMFSAFYSQAWEKDTEGGKWLIEEDIDWGADEWYVPYAALRSLEDPSRTDMYNAGLDRYGSRGAPYDLENPHVQAGIGNKLAFLLTDGETFNNQDVAGMGLVKASKLLFESSHLLNPTSGYKDLYLALIQAAVNLNYTDSERTNIANACRAVEIAMDVTPWVADSTFVTPQNILNVYAGALQSDGKAVLSCNVSGQSESYQIIRLNTDGSFDTGSAALTLNGIAYAVAIQADGKIIVGGSFGAGLNSQNPYLCRFNADGTKDTAFTRMALR